MTPLVTVGVAAGPKNGIGHNHWCVGPEHATKVALVTPSMRPTRAAAGRRARRLLGPEPVLPPLQASHRRPAGAVPDARKNRLTGRKPLQETPERPPYHSS